MKIGGKKVVDARKPLVLYVNKADIAGGQVKAPGKCAIARACMRQEEGLSARVHLSCTYIEQADKWMRYKTPNSARTEIVSFDRGHKFEEGVYKFGVSAHTNKLGTNHKSGKIEKARGSRKKEKKRIKPRILTNVRASAMGSNVWGAKVTHD